MRTRPSTSVFARRQLTRRVVCVTERHALFYSGRRLVKTDIAIAIPEGHYGRIAPRSGLAAKHGIDIGAGVIDRDYRSHAELRRYAHCECRASLITIRRIDALVGFHSSSLMSRPRRLSLASCSSLASSLPLGSTLAHSLLLDPSHSP
jgi:hypothetical protein